jgi:hypothetical protein
MVGTMIPYLEKKWHDPLSGKKILKFVRNCKENVCFVLKVFVACLPTSCLGTSNFEG